MLRYSGKSPPRSEVRYSYAYRDRYRYINYGSVRAVETMQALVQILILVFAPTLTLTLTLTLAVP